MTTTEAPKKAKVPKNTYYIKNSELLIQIQRFKNTCKYDEAGKYIKNSGRMDEELGASVLKIARGLCSKGNFSGYTWTDDMIGEAVLTVCKYMHNFNPEKSDNPFAYITQICNHAFKNYLKGQKKHSVIKDKLMNGFSGMDKDFLDNPSLKGYDEGDNENGED